MIVIEENFSWDNPLRFRYYLCVVFSNGSMTKPLTIFDGALIADKKDPIISMCVQQILHVHKQKKGLVVIFGIGCVISYEASLSDYASK